MFRVGFPFRVFLFFAFLIVLVWLLGSHAAAQQSKSDNGNQAASDSSQGQGQEADALKRTITEKQKKQNAKSLKQELRKTYKKWMDEEDSKNNTDEEHTAFKQSYME